MRPTILILAALAAILALPGAAFAFEVDATAPDAPKAPRFSDPNAPVAFQGLQALGPDGSAHFSDPADSDTGTGSLQLLGGSLQISGGAGVAGGGVGGNAYTGMPNYIPGAPASSDLPPLLYSAPALRSSR
jgi:hypothetical protein